MLGPVRSEWRVIVILVAGRMWHENEVRVNCCAETTIEEHDNALFVATVLHGSKVPTSAVNLANEQVANMD